MISTLRKIGFKASVYKFFSRLFPNDKNVLSACARIGAYRYLKKYQCVLKNIEKQSINTQQPIATCCPFPTEGSYDSSRKHIIWLCWLQGYDKAPLLMQKCRDSVFRHNPTMDIIIVDKSNLNQYVSFPDYINQKYTSGIIPNAHYADLIRICLLEKYGGTWIDATVLMTDKLPEYISNSELFCYKTTPLGYSVASNWLISAHPNNPIIHQMKTLLFEYWKNENKLVSYSIFHLFWTMTVTFNDTNKTLWKNVPYFEDANCKILRWELFDQFYQERFDQIKAITSIHKLTYKFGDYYTNAENTYYDYIIKH